MAKMIAMDTVATRRHLSGRVQIGEFIRLRKMTQSEFARQVDCSEPHLSLILKGERGMSFGLAKRISEATEIPIGLLPHGRGI